MSKEGNMANKEQIPNGTPGTHLLLTATPGTATTFHNADVSGHPSIVASVNDTTASDAVSAAAQNKGPQAKAVQVNVGGYCRVSNPS
jgi:hypothetical protein